MGILSSLNLQSHGVKPFRRVFPFNSAGCCCEHGMSRQGWPGVGDEVGDLMMGSHFAVPDVAQDIPHVGRGRGGG